MNKLFLLFIPAMLWFTGCSKGVNNDVGPITQTSNTNGTVNTQGYVVVKCDNCQLNYGMPDQFRSINISGTSANAPFTYTSGYTLQANIYAADHDQNITYTVYNTKGVIIYQNAANQSVEGYWAVNVLLP